MARGWIEEQILDGYPSLRAEDIGAGLAYASEVLHAVVPLASNPIEE